MGFVKVGAASLLPAGSVMEALIGDRSYAVCNLDGHYHALDGTCPHAGGPLGQGRLEGGLVVCPWHEWAFECITGSNDYDPAIKLELFPVKVEGGDILVNPDIHA